MELLQMNIRHPLSALPCQFLLGVSESCRSLSECREEILSSHEKPSGTPGDARLCQIAYRFEPAIIDQPPISQSRDDHTSPHTFQVVACSCYQSRHALS